MCFWTRFLISFWFQSFLIYALNICLQTREITTAWNEVRNNLIHLTWRNYSIWKIPTFLLFLHSYHVPSWISLNSFTTNCVAVTVNCSNQIRTWESIDSQLDMLRAEHVWCYTLSSLFVFLWNEVFQMDTLHWAKANRVESKLEINLHLRKSPRQINDTKEHFVTNDTWQRPLKQFKPVATEWK